MEKIDLIFEDDVQKIEVEDDIYNETYSIIDNYNNMKNNLVNRNNEIKLLNLNYEKLENEYNLLLKKYSKEIDLNEKNSELIKSLRKDILEQNKKVLMLKNLLELIVNKYGIDSVCKMTRLNEEQIKKYLNYGKNI